jgi:hypothetical protein
MPIGSLPPADAKPPPGVAAGADSATTTGAAIPGGLPAAAGATADLPSSGVPPGVAPGLDRADIQPLNVPAALGILVAEARTALGLPPQNGPIQSPTQAAIGLVSNFLLSLPPGLAGPLDPGAPTDAILPPGITPPVDAGVAPDASARSSPAEITEAGVALAWNAAHLLLQGRLTAGMEQAAAAVSAWRDTDPAVIHAVNESRAMVLLAVGDEPLDGLLAKPEWLWLVPRLEAFRRRRRAVRRRLQDPDYQTPDAADEWIAAGP